MPTSPQAQQQQQLQEDRFKRFWQPEHQAEFTLNPPPGCLKRRGHLSGGLARAEALRAEPARHGGSELPDTIPRVTHARPFGPITALLGPRCENWLPVHGASYMQIGRRYPFLLCLTPAQADIYRLLRAALDPDRPMNPDVLED